MRLFLRDIAIFIVGFILLNLILYRLVTYRFLFRDYEVKARELNCCDTFIFGDSHGWMLTRDNKRGDSVLRSHGIFNFSYGSDSYFDIYLKLDWLIENGRVPRRILLSADRHMLSRRRESNNNLNRSILYSTFSSFKQVRDIVFLEFFVRKYVLRYLPMLQSSNSKLVKEVLYSVFDKDERGLDWSVVPDSTKAVLSLRKMNDHFPSYDESRKLEAFLSDIFALCDKHKIEIIGVKYPLANSYYSLVKGINLGVDEVFNANNLNVLDFEKLFIGSDGNFANQDHVNLIGANQLIKDLLLEI